MAASSPTPTTDDLSALSWVQDELRRSLELSNKALRRYLKEAESATDLDTVDPGVLRQARNQLHQSVGVLELVGLAGPASVLRAAEAALQRLSARPRLITLQSVHAIEHGAFAVLEFIDRKLAGKPVTPLALFPQYRTLQELAGATRVHPADLWPVPWTWRLLPADPMVSARHPDAALVGRIEADLLALMRGPVPATAARMSDVFAGLGAGVSGRLGTLWQLAAAFFEAQADGVLALDVYSKRVGSRLLSQLRAGDGGEPSERLAHDMLYFCSQARLQRGRPAGPRLAAVRRVYALGDEAPVDLEVPKLGRFDPAWVVQARKRIQGAKDVWSAVAGGDTDRLPMLAEQFALVADSMQRLFPDGAVLGRALQAAAAQVGQSGREPPAELAMEVATALLYLDASVDDGEFDHAETAERIQRLAQRIEQVRQGRDPGTLEMWMEELYRRVSDRQTIGSVVQELRASLSEVEKQIDQYFRDPAKREVLIPVPGLLGSMRGVLSVLGLDQASAAVLRMRDDVDALAATEVDPQRAIQAGTFDRLADNLGALSFLIDMVSVQPQMAKSLFRFDPATGALSAVVAREDRPTGFDNYELPSEAGGPPTAQPTDVLAVSLEFERMDHQARAGGRGAAASHDLTAPLPMFDLDGLEADEVTLRLPTPDQVTQVMTRPAEDPGLGLPTIGHDMDARLPEPADDVTMRMPLSSDELTLRLPAVADDVTQRLPLQGDEVTLRMPLANDGVTQRLPLAPMPPSPPPAADSGLADDPEMREIFLEEAREVIASSREALQALADEPADAGQLTAVRRGFHTLKGSARMVGLRDFGEAAWSCEQLYNSRQASHAVADDDLRGFSAEALDHFERWIDAIEAGDASAFDSGVVARVADLLRTEGRRLPLAVADDVALPLAPVEPLHVRIPDLPGAADLDLSAPVPAPATAADEPALELTEADLALTALNLPPEAVVSETPDIALPDLDLGALDDTAQAMPVAEASELTDLPLDLDDATSAADLPLAFDSTAVLTPAMAPLPEPSAPAPVVADDNMRQIGPLRISIPLFNIFLNESDELSRRLGVALAEWALELHRPVGDGTVALAHSLAGGAGAVGYADLSQLARELEHALERSHARGRGTADEAALFTRAANEINRLLHLFAAGFLNSPEPGLLPALHELAHAAPDVEVVDEPTELGSLADSTAPATALDLPLEPPALVADTGMLPLGRTELKPLAELAPAVPREAPVADEGVRFDDEIDAQDAIDAELFPIFEDEALELLPQVQAALRDWALHPADTSAASACMRSLHTFKGGARLSGAMRLGELAHRLETAVARLAASPSISGEAVEQLLARVDTLDAQFEQLRRRASGAPLTTAAELDALSYPAEQRPQPVADLGAPPAVPSVPVVPRDIDWQRFGHAPLATRAEHVAGPQAGAAPVSGGSVRVRAQLLDRLVNEAGEVSIARARIDTDVRLMKSALGDLADNLERLRAQLRDIEVQAESQIATRMEAARVSAQGFDPLEMDRFTRFQELTRMMAESVSDVATVQRGLQRTVQSAEDALAHQGRMTRDMQEDLLRTRMVEFEGLSERLYRVVRQAAKETAKPVRLDILGGSIEIDRGVLDRMTPSFEHLLRNSVVHGIEPAAQRQAAGKDLTGSITVAVSQVGNEVAVEVRDDGAGLDLPRIRDRARALGLIAPDAWPSDSELANLVFQPNFSTAEQITDLAGRGVGMDVVRTEVNAMGGRIETASAPGQGASFRLVLPLTTAVTQVVMLRSGDRAVAVPATLLEVVRRASAEDLAVCYGSGRWHDEGQDLPFFWLDGLLQGSRRGQAAAGRSAAVVIIRSAAQRIALHVDEVVGNQEVVIKNLGPQLSRLPGLVGMTLLPSGLPALIYNPVALATLYGEQAQAQARQAGEAGRGAVGTEHGLASDGPQAPLVLVVDDSLTVRRVTQRLLQREGYRVTTAKDGQDGLDKLSGELPAVVLTDIEMPRMDGFDLVRHMKADHRLARLPLVMITSRIAAKHREYAAELGVNHYLGKPYDEDELLRLVAQYARAAVA